MRNRQLIPAAALVLSLAMLAACDATQAPDESVAPDAAATDPAAQEPGPAGAPATSDPATPDGAASPDVAAETQITATGNEPFWSVEADGNTLTYSTPALMPGVDIDAEREAIAGGVRFTGEYEGSPFVFEVRNQECQDTMSGWMFDFTASVTADGRTMTGCARRSSDPVGEA